MFGLVWWVITSWYGCALILIISFNNYLKRKTGERLFGTFNFDIPKNLVWIFVFGIIGSVIMLFYPVAFLIHPDVVNVSWPISVLTGTSFEILGICLVILGGAISTVSMFHLGLSARFLLPEQESRLVTSGIYGLCRNPIYVGIYFSFLGIFFLLPSPVYLVGFCLFLLNNHFRILQEEKFLVKSFGAEYENYRQRVGRYFPRVGMAK